ncbi:MAG: Crp/Fnr family transcriptional regulator [Acidobacteria bacterium]|nr:Crp/Fnr family transcriptional regulator [Acidobacteriota bacterium]
MPTPSADLAGSRIFDGLVGAERNAWIEAARAREFTRGAVVARQGEPATEFYLVASGFLKVVQGTADGHELIVRFVGPHEPFGGVVALDGATYPVTAVAVEFTRLISWNLEVLQPLLERSPRVRANIMREMATHMTDALTRVQELSTARVGQRLAQALLRLMRQCGRSGDDGSVVLRHSLTRQELADLTGTTLYTVSRTLSQWTNEGILGSAGRRVVIRDRARLEKLAV